MWILWPSIFLNPIEDLYPFLLPLLSLLIYLLFYFVFIYLSHSSFIILWFSTRSLEHLQSTGANWVAIVVTQYQDKIDTTDIYPLYDPIYSDYYTYITATNQELASAIEKAHELNMKVMLKPHIDLTRDPNHWRGDIGRGFKNESQWSSWFDSYTKMAVGMWKMVFIKHALIYYLWLI